MKRFDPMAIQDDSRDWPAIKKQRPSITPEVIGIIAIVIVLIAIVVF